MARNVCRYVQMYYIVLYVYIFIFFSFSSAGYFQVLFCFFCASLFFFSRKFMLPIGEIKMNTCSQCKNVRVLYTIFLANKKYFFNLFIKFISN